MFPQTYNQVQNWPSPNFWEGKRLSIRTLPEVAFSNVQLSLFVNVVPIDQTQTDNLGQSNTALTKWDNGGPAGDRTLTDTFNGVISLTTFINFVAVDRSIQDDTFGNIQLTAFMSPTSSGDRTLTDDFNGNIALTKWQQ